MSLTPTRFLGLLGLLCAGYLALELAYVERLPMVMDEFQGAADVYRIRDQVPYRDFDPYKTVLGYYLQVPMLLLGDDVYSSMVWVKRITALINALAIFGAALLLRRQFGALPALLATASFCCVSTFLERSGELRVDMITAWAGLFSLFMLLERRVAVAGLLAGLSFLLSQKGAFYCVAGGLTLAVLWALVERDRAALKRGLVFAGCAVAMVLLYLGVCALLSDPSAVIHDTFVKPRQVTLVQLKTSVHNYWLQTIQRNPYFYAMALLAIGSAFVLRDRDQDRVRHWQLWVYGGSMLTMCFLYRQPWPYFFVMLLPTLYVLVAWLISELARVRLGPAFWAGFVLLGLAYPLTRIPKVMARDNSYQRHVVRLAEELLEPDDRYIAGMKMVWTHDHGPGGLSWIDRRRADKLRRTAPDKIIAVLDRQPSKLLIWNYRLDKLPHKVRRYLDRRYCHVSGSVRIYCPAAEKKRVNLLYSGDYRVEGRDQVTLDGEVRKLGDVVRLKAGRHKVDKGRGLRLRFMSKPHMDLQKDPFPKQRALFPGIYDY